MEVLPSRQPELSIVQKFWQLNWLLVLLITVTASIGFAMLYSAANGSLEPWAYRQMIRFALGFLVMLIIAVSSIRFWLRYAYFIYLGCLGLLFVVEFYGSTGMGAQRWIDLGYMTLQPSEVMKIVIILALSRYFYASRMEDIEKLTYLIIPILILAAPTVLIIRQPDLGTAVLIGISGIAIFFLAGVRMWIFITSALAGLGSLVPIWKFVLLEYQKARILIYLRPEKDPLGAGYHVMQSKIALGSGGFSGKGFQAGSQSHLSFLPEKHTDFIFTMLAEEFGLVGGAVLLILYFLIMVYGFAISLRCRHHFGRLVGLGITMVFFLNFFVNIAMVMGLLPVVGMPLPLVSYGGTALLTNMFGFGLILCIFVNRDLALRPGAADTNF